MPRIAGVNIPENKQIGIGLSYIYGIGPALAKKILILAKIDFWLNASELNHEEISRLKDIIEKNDKIEG